MEAIIAFVLRDRVRAGDVASVLMSAGGFLFIAGAVGNVVMKAFSVSIARSGRAAPTSLNDLFPGFPLFWVPEGPLGYIVAGLLLIAGIWFARIVRRLTKF